MNELQKYFDLFFDEKDLPEAIWEIEAADGTLHIVESGYVIEAIKTAPEHEQAAIRDMLTRLDFVNAPIMPYLEHLARGLVANW